MGTEDFADKFKGLKVAENQDINILLLGETGVGKSTFINAIANYLHYKQYKKVEKAELLVLIPSLMTVTNQNYEQVTIQVGSDNNEYQEIGAAGTQGVKTYVFPIGEGKIRLRLIDSPGMGDPRGVEQDDINCENILAYLAQLRELHAICFLMRPTTTRKTVLFEYCVKQILSRLEKSASRNIIFIFTNTRGTDYTPGETLPCLRTVIDSIKANPPHVDIPLKDNIFSFDNEAFRFLVAKKHGIMFPEDIEGRFIESWNTSSRECWKLISYIVGDASRDPLKPHQLHNTISINEARRLIVQLSQPLADISQLIYDNIRILEKHKYNLKLDNQSLDDLKKKMYIPIIDLEVTQLTQPVTVCTSTKCADIVKVGEVKKWHYRQRCHDPCYLTTVAKEFVGDVNLINCAAMNGQKSCSKCTCDYSVHMHVYYLTVTKNNQIVDDVVRNNIHQKEAALREAQRLMGEIDRRKNELELERDVIIKSTAQFAHFLQHNAISPFNDSYKAYIEYLITREKSLGRNGDPGVIANLEQLLRRYEEIKTAFDSSLQLNQQFGLNTVVASSVTAQSVMNTIHNLYQLKHNGKKIHELCKKQKSSRNSEYDKNCEYVHPKTTGVYSGESKKKDKSKSDKKKDGKSTDDDKGNKKDKTKKDKNKTDDERKDQFQQGQQRGRFFNRGGGRGRGNHNQYTHQQPNAFHRDAPPPYPGDERQQSSRVPSQTRYEDPNFVVKVELTQGPSRKKANCENSNYPFEQSAGYGPPQSQYQGTPQGHYQGPPQGQYQGPSQGQYYGPPQGQYYGSPQGPYYGPPQGPYHGPPQGNYQGPPQNNYQGPPLGYYQGPPHGQYHGPSHAPPRGSYQKYPHRGRNQFKKGSGHGRSHSRHGKSTDRKSGKEQSERSSDSSSD